MKLDELEFAISRLKLLAQAVKADASDLCLLFFSMVLSAGLCWCFGVLKYQLLITVVGVLLYFLLKKLATETWKKGRTGHPRPACGQKTHPTNQNDEN